MRRVAIYARVSTEHEEQLSALENQIQYYDELLKRHPDWQLYDRYVDEGITGTSVKKRQSFLRMMEDAKHGCFDLIITREVSRFARNTVDTLQQTRELKRMGIEVYFIEDNIWTMKDDDGELRLTIMATLAQNESKKTSIRVKAGQAISFQNGVLYGNGNILGYNKVGDRFVLNMEQAETVRMIFDMYLSGIGMNPICRELERRGRLTATGLSRWSASNVARVLKNPFYCGTIVYRKQYVPDYLEQKKVKNFDAVPKVIIEGKHECIVTKAEFDAVQKLISEKSYYNKNLGHSAPKKKADFWGEKLKCQCGAGMGRAKYSVSKERIQYAYGCYGQRRTGTVRKRSKLGLDTTDTCSVPMVQEWKLKMMAYVILEKYWTSRQDTLALAQRMLEKYMGTASESDAQDISGLENQIKKLDTKLDTLVDMRLSGEINRDTFLQKKTLLENQKTALQIKLKKCTIKTEYSKIEVEEKLQQITKALQQKISFDADNIPKEVLDVFVYKIIAYKDYFAWYLRFSDEVAHCSVSGRKGTATVNF